MVEVQGKKYIDNIYNNVGDFTDLLKTNIDFFSGELPNTYYYLASWGHGTDQKDHAIY